MFDLDEIFAVIDQDAGGTISFDEFISSALDPKILWKDEVARIAFKQFDSDGSGLTNVKEMNECLAPLFKVKDHVWEKILGL